jgi:hypothetical protein
MNIEGILEAGSLRDYLYAKMRGARSHELHPEAGAKHSADEALKLLREIRDLLQRKNQS